MVELQAIGAPLGTKIGGEVFCRQQAGGDPIACLQDGLDPDKTERGFDRGYDFRRARGDLQPSFQRCDRICKGDDFIRAFHIGKEYDVRASRHHPPEVVQAIAGKTIDPHRANDFVIPATLHQCGHTGSRQRAIGG